MAMMDPREFSRLSDACLDRAVTWAERFDPDEVDFATGDGVVTLDSLGEGKYHLSVSHSDYFPAEDNDSTFELPADEGRELGIRMRAAGDCRVSALSA